MIDTLAIGIIRGTHGVSGYLKVKSFSGEGEHFSSLKQIRLVNGDRTSQGIVEDVRISSSMILLKLEGIDSPETGKKFNGWEIWVPRKEASRLAKDEFYVADLDGCEIVVDGALRGVVSGVVESGPVDLLEVTHDNDRKTYIPFRDQFVGNVDVSKKRIELLAPWLLE